ncbi:hypothetical protein AOQ84DRAFT_419001 [Glonium stellatum]|uniref:Uncharacterized protein n=1 Tax=Glonium stellatum TaxID=574774 RepID=A0A8E2ERY6_9PEZI|nr:hypothetical protein AOQ84DRAFT_419001 [Glonium stellatum]
MMLPTALASWRALALTLALAFGTGFGTGFGFGFGFGTALSLRRKRPWRGLGIGKLDERDESPKACRSAPQSPASPHDLSSPPILSFPSLFVLDFVNCQICWRAPTCRTDKA